MGKRVCFKWYLLKCGAEGHGQDRTRRVGDRNRNRSCFLPLKRCNQRWALYVFVCPAQPHMEGGSYLPSTGSVRLHHRSQMKQDSGDVAILNLPVRSSREARHPSPVTGILGEDHNLAHSSLCSVRNCWANPKCSLVTLPKLGEGCGVILCKAPEGSLGPGDSAPKMCDLCSLSYLTRKRFV